MIIIKNIRLNIFQKLKERKILRNVFRLRSFNNQV